jgi:hypothetical protein
MKLLHSYVLIGLIALAGPILAATPAPLPTPNLSISTVTASSASAAWKWTGPTSSAITETITLLNVTTNKTAAGYPRAVSYTTTSTTLAALSSSTHYRLSITYKNTANGTTSGTGTAYFTTLPADPQKVADVIGNPGFWYISGHVGLWGGSYVLEVLNDSSGANGTCVHYNETLASFKNGGYWGARYSNGITPATASQIIYNGYQQSTFNAKYNLFAASCVWGHYTTSLVWNATTRKYVSKTVMTNASLRCDIFVAGAYQNSSNVNISPVIWTPANVFNDLPLQRM